MYYRKAKKISYGNKRDRKNVRYIVIHYTGNNGDTAKNNVDYFATTNQRSAGAHLFVGAKGVVAKSIPLNRSAWAVGGNFGDGKYYGACTNFNSVSIELADAMAGWTPGHVKGVKKAIKYIQKYCPNAKTIICHHDVNGKKCPAWYKSFKDFKKDLGV